MKDLKQLWLISIDPNRLNKTNNTLTMQNGSVRVKQLGHFIESARNGGYRNSARSSLVSRNEPVDVDNSSFVR